MQRAHIENNIIELIEDTKDSNTYKGSDKNGWFDIDTKDYMIIQFTVSDDKDADYKISNGKLFENVVVKNNLKRVDALSVKKLKNYANYLQSKILQVSQDKKNYYTSKAAIALNSLTNTELLSQFEYEAKSKGFTTEQLRDIVLAKANEAYTAFSDIESKLKQALQDLSSAKTVKAKDKVVTNFIALDKNKED